jgi:hypothetical protein
MPFFNKGHHQTVLKTALTVSQCGVRVGTESFVDLIMAEKYWNGSVFMEIGVVRSYSIQCIEKQRILAIEYGLRP